MIEDELPRRAPLEVWFEVHTLSHDRWTIDTITRERKVAFEEAECIIRQFRVTGVRVVREVYNPDSRRATMTTLFEDVHGTNMAGRRGARTHRGN